MIEQLVARVFATRNAAHLVHWKVHGPGSYAQHMALDAFYTELIGLIDKYVEMHQGAFGLMKGVSPATVPTANLTEHIAEEAKWIEDNRERLSQDVCALENALDEIVGLYLTTYYKLKNLA
jgi:DNA-binding ferritin-like protein